MKKCASMRSSDRFLRFPGWICLITHRFLISNRICRTWMPIRSAKNGFAEEFREFQIPVVFPEELQAQIPEHLRGSSFLRFLHRTRRAAYNKKPDYIYGMAFDDYDIRFTVAEGILTVKEVTRRTQEWKKVKLRVALACWKVL